MRQAYDYWQDQPGTYHRRRARPPGLARQGAGPNARSRAPRPGLTPGPLALRRQARGLSPVQVASDARARLPAPRRSVPQAGPGAMRGGPHGRSLASPRPAPPSASARSRRLQTPGRVSPRLGGARLRPGWGPSCPCGVAPSGARSPSSPGQTASPPPSGSHVPSGSHPPVLSGCVLRLGRRRATRRPQPARFPWDGRPHGKAPPGYAAATARLTPRARLDATAHRRQDTDAPRPGRRQRPCHRALCVLTRRGCPILYDPAQCAPAKTEALLPSRFREGRRDLLPSQMGGEERGLLLLPSMHYFWRGDMPHFSPPLPFQPRAGARPQRAQSGAPACAGQWWSPTPAAGASSTSAGLSGAPARAGLRWSLTPADGVPSTSAGQSRAPAHARRQRSPNPCGGRAIDLGRPDTLADGGQPGAARTAPVRRGVTTAISNWPAAPAAGQSKQARAPVAGGLAPFSHYF